MWHTNWHNAFLKQFTTKVEQTGLLLFALEQRSPTSLQQNFTLDRSGDNQLISPKKIKNYFLDTIHCLCNIRSENESFSVISLMARKSTQILSWPLFYQTGTSDTCMGRYLEVANNAPMLPLLIKIWLTQCELMHTVFYYGLTIVLKMNFIYLLNFYSWITIIVSEVGVRSFPSWLHCSCFNYTCSLFIS